MTYNLSRGLYVQTLDRPPRPRISGLSSSRRISRARSPARAPSGPDHAGWVAPRRRGSACGTLPNRVRHSTCAKLGRFDQMAAESRSPGENGLPRSSFDLLAALWVAIRFVPITFR
jgi:hypothetical protein